MFAEERLPGTAFLRLTCTMRPRRPPARPGGTHRHPLIWATVMLYEPLAFFRGAGRRVWRATMGMSVRARIPPAKDSVE